MKSDARRELGNSIQKEGVILSDDPQRIKALLMDTCPESHTEIGLLVAAAEDDIPARLARLSDSVFRDSEIALAVGDLKRTRRLDHGAAEWVVHSWAWALGLLDDEPPDDPAEVPRQGFAPRAAPPVFETTAPHESGLPDPSRFARSSQGYGGTSQPSGPVPLPRSTPFAENLGQSAPPSTSGGSAPVSQGPVPGGWNSGPPPSAGGWPVAPPPPPPPPPRRGRGRLVAIVAAVAVAAGVVVAAAGAAVNVLLPGNVPTPSTITAAPTSAPTPPTSNQVPADVNFSVVDGLGSGEIADTVTVYSFGRQVGTLRVNSASPVAELALTGPPGEIDYQLNMEMVLTDGRQVSLNGSGTVTAFEGARYSVQIATNAAGIDVVTLQAASAT